MTAGAEIQALLERLRRVNEPRGYYLNADARRVEDLLEGLIRNRERYGYMACPCRLASGDREADKDIICPCDYREADIAEFGTCYCNLYVSASFIAENQQAESIPERRPLERLPF